MRWLSGWVLFVGAGATASADEALPEPAALVSRYVAARGGAERLAAITSLIFRGTYREGDYSSDHAAMAMLRPYYKLVGDPERPSPDFAEGYDGSAWEYYGDPGIVVRTVGAAAAALRHNIWVDGPLVDAAAKGNKVTIVGTDTVDGRPAYRLLVRMADGFEEEELVDVEAGLHVASRKRAPVHAFGTTVHSETRFGDFRSVEGVLFPFRVREVEVGTGRLLNEMTYREIVVNRPLDPAVFSPPSFTQTPVQRLIEQLYLERSDTDALMWTYREFSRAQPDIETEAAIQFVGYQMLKMGDRPSAIALLEENAAGHPRSAGAAFGVGRAYATAGRTAEARAAFERALALDPAHLRAQDALRALPPR